MSERLTRRDKRGKVHYAKTPKSDYIETVLEEQAKIESEVLNRLAVYEDLEEQGLLVKLPCKVGDKVYFVTDKGMLHFGIIETIIDKVGVRSTGLFFKMDCNALYETAISAIGKTVFFTREEAEKRLKEIMK